MGINVGIDLGTTFSAIAKINENTGKPEVIKNAFGNTIIPSVLYFEQNGNILFGEDAKNMQEMGDSNAIAFFKRNMGNDTFCVEFFGKQYSATELSSIYLSKITTEAEEYLGEKIESAVITVPAYFTHKERQATMKAGEMAGLNVIEIINEPTAAAFAYGLNKKINQENILIYDLGGGTFDVTVASISDTKINILGSDGNHELGGKDWDDCIARYIVQQFNEKYGVDLSEDEALIASLLVTAEHIKKQLTYKDKVNVPINFKGIKGNIIITEDTFREISSFLLGETKELTNKLLQSISMKWENIDGVILVGGSTRMRMIHNYVKEMSGKEALAGINVDEAVALGAAIKANIIEESKLANSTTAFLIGRKELSDVTAHALGMIAISDDGEKYINSIIIPKNSKIPIERKKEYKFKARGKNDELIIYVLQGQYLRPLDNVIINKYIISEIENISSGTSIIEVSYRYTSNGVVEVSALQKEIHKKLGVSIENIDEDLEWSDESPQKQSLSSEMEIILAIDLSYSMKGEPLEEAKVAMINFINQMNVETTKIGLLVFADEVHWIRKQDKDYSKLKKEILSLDVGIVGICNKAEPFSEVAGSVDESSDKARYMIVLTDGAWWDQERAINEAKNCNRKGIETIALGFGDAVQTFLQEITSVEGGATLTNLGGLSEEFCKIAQVIEERNNQISL